MNYLTSVLALDAASAASFGVLSSPHLDADNDGQGGACRLLAALQHEADYAATMTAVCASIANVLEHPTNARTVTARALKTYAAQAMPVFEAVAPRLLDDARFARAAESYLALSARLSLAHRMSLAYSEELTGAAHPSVDLAGLQSAWRHACAAALRLRHELCGALAVDVGLRQPSRSPASHRQLSCLVLAAANGGHPCVDDDGSISIPGWAERRRHTRQIVDVAIEIEIALRTYLVHAFDASAGGIGLEGLPLGNTFEPGDPAILRLLNGRQLHGHIAWIAGARAGVTLLEPLAADDPVFQAI